MISFAARFLAAAAIVLVSFATSPAAEFQGSRPNIVFMLADDMGWAQPGFNGGNRELTPNLDRMAGESLRLT